MFANRLIFLRKQKNVTQQRVASFLGITRPAYTAYERGSRKPGYETLKRLAGFYDVSIDYLITGKETGAAGSSANESGLTPEEQSVLNVLRRHPALFQALASEPDKHISRLAELWEFIRKSS
ncbi:helix-turn-helix domain-containing protein [Metabacillus kandeliae]|uniref:helix-turn-helix domain-containing protein n=1 Tax=Metabacillus kandeliae TaxID=2900151 RepID=UPI002F9086C1